MKLDCPEVFAGLLDRKLIVVITKAGNVTTAGTLTLTPSPSPIKEEQGGFIQG
jgi:hypothetical protein